MTQDAVNAISSEQRDDEWSVLLYNVGQSRDEQAFAKIFDHFSPIIKGFCINANMNGLPFGAAEEIVQEVMIKVWQKSPSYDKRKAAASTWIYTVMRNCRIDLIRKNKRHQVNDAEVDVDDIWDDLNDNHPFVELQSVRQEEMFQKSFALLPNEQREALIQVYMKGKSHNEVSQETGLPLGTVKSRIRMGLKKLQSIVKV